MKNYIVTRRIIAMVLVLMTFSVMFMSTASAASASSYKNTHVNTGDYVKDFIAVAKTQVGYKEGYNNDTKYGDWYGLPYQPWCAMFVSWCARQAGIPKSIIANSAIASPGAAYFNLPKQYDGKNYTPKPGDIFFTRTFGHVGIVCSVEGDYFYSVEGNTNDTGGPVGVGVFYMKRPIKNYIFAHPNYPEQHKCSKGELLYNAEEHPHYAYYACKGCDKVIEDKKETAFFENCIVCNPHVCEKGVYLYNGDEHPHYAYYSCRGCEEVIIDKELTAVDDMCPQCNVQSEGTILGDANGGGVVNIKDATLIQKYIASLDELSAVAKVLSDVDSSGGINIKDATAIQRYVAGIETGFDIGRPFEIKQNFATADEVPVPAKLSSKASQ